MLSTRGAIAKLAVDGNLVAAYTLHIAGANDRIVVWSSPGSNVKQFVTKFERGDEYSIGLCTSCGPELALGAGRVAWREIFQSNFADYTIYAAPVAGGAAEEIVNASNGRGASGQIDGDYVGQLLGSDSSLFYNQWSVCDYQNHDPYKPTPECPVQGKISGQKLMSIATGQPVEVASGPQAFALAAVGGGRLAFEPVDVDNYGFEFHHGGTVTVTTSAGEPVSTVPGDPPLAVALSKTHLLIERAGEIDSYDPATGEQVGTIPSDTDSVRLVGVNARLALLRGLHQLVLIRLRDGKRITIPVSSGVVVDARLNEIGLFYAYNVSSGVRQGRIVYESAARLLARF